MLTSESNVLEPSQTDDIKKAYYRYTTIHLLITGLWPYKRTKFTRVHRIICASGFFNNCLLQMLIYINTSFTSSLLSHDLLDVVISLSFCLLYSTLWHKQDTIKEIMDIVQQDWRTVRNVEEFNILTKHAKEAIRHSRYFCLFMYSTMMIGTVFYVINFTELLNIPDLHSLPIWMQTTVNEKCLRYISYCILCILMFLANATSIATESISTMTFQHLRSLFEIASNRIKEAFIYNSLHDSTSGKSFKMTESLKSSIHLHVKCMKVLMYLKQIYMMLSFLLCGFGVLILGISMFLCLQSYLLHRINYIFLYVIISMIEIVCLFRVNYTTQTMLDAYNNVFVELYNIEWYEAPLHVQKIILFMMLKYSFPLSFNMFGVFSACMEGFSSLGKMTVSYFMVIYSTMR